MRVLVLTTEPISAEQLRDALGEEPGAGETEVKVVAPALHESALRFCVSDADEAIAKAEEARCCATALLSSLLTPRHT
jgi:hypothetical protein